MSERDKQRDPRDYLFQRFNMFLVATSFLVATFVTLIASIEPSGSSRTPNIYLVSLIHAIAALGSIISLIFLVIDFFLAAVLESPQKGMYPVRLHEILLV